MFDDVPDIDDSNIAAANDDDSPQTEKPKPTPRTRIESVIKSAVQSARGSQPNPSPSIVPPLPQKTHMDLSGVKVGTHVKHKTFGDGTIINMERDLILVSFGKEEKKFQVPQAFENGFLRMV